jgi:hypothetical protein
LLGTGRSQYSEPNIGFFGVLATVPMIVLIRQRKAAHNIWSKLREGRPLWAAEAFEWLSQESFEAAAWAPNYVMCASFCAGVALQ